MSRLHYFVVAAPWLLLFTYVFLGVATSPDARGYGTHEQLGFGACLFREWFGGPCPTCGVTTSASHVAHGQVGAAWVTQPLGVVLVLVAFVGIPAALLAHRRRIDLGSAALRHGGKVGTATAVVVVACWLVL